MESDVEIRKYLNRIRQAHPVIHCITNTVTMNDCANLALALGASPTMAHHEKEVEEIAAGADALVCNLGATECLDAMFLAGKKAHDLGHPIVLDPVGVAGSSYRRKKCMDLVRHIEPTCIRGNYSEMLALMGQHNTAVGVDAADKSLDPQRLKQLAEELDCILVASGPTDWITDGKRIESCERGHVLMSYITGSGCMSTVAIAAFLTADPSVESVHASCELMGKAGEAAAKRTKEVHGGSMTFHDLFLDHLSLQGILWEDNTHL